MLASLPFALQILLLGAIGLAIGVLINWAIYAWRRDVVVGRQPVTGFLRNR